MVGRELRVVWLEWLICERGVVWGLEIKDVRACVIEREVLIKLEDFEKRVYEFVLELLDIEV